MCMRITNKSACTQSTMSQHIYVRTETDQYKAQVRTMYTHMLQVKLVSLPTRHNELVQYMSVGADMDQFYTRHG